MPRADLSCVISQDLLPIARTYHSYPYIALLDYCNVSASLYEALLPTVNKSMPTPLQPTC